MLSPPSAQSSLSSPRTIFIPLCNRSLRSAKVASQPCQSHPSTHPDLASEPPAPPYSSSSVSGPTSPHRHLQPWFQQSPPCQPRPSLSIRPNLAALVSGLLHQSPPFFIFSGQALRLWSCIRHHRSFALAYALYARKLKLENSKLVRVFADLSRNYTDLISKPSYKVLFNSDVNSIDESVLRQFEKEVKERIKVTRQVIAEAKESFNNQLKIQKLKDPIFAVNERLTKSKKQGTFSSLIATKSIPKSLHCLTMRLIKERIANLEKYSNEGKPVPPEIEDPKLYYYAIFSDNVIAAYVVVNSSSSSIKEISSGSSLIQERQKYLS